MRVTRYVAFVSLLTFATALGAAPPPGSPFTLPTAPVKPAPPTPAPNPGAVPKLTGDVLYVINSNVDAVVRAHPAKLVTVTKEAGPIRIRGKFIDGSGKTETRTFPGPHVFVIEATGAGAGRVDLDLIPFGLKSAAEIETAAVDVDNGQAPRPPPKPDPVPPPKPKPPEPKPDPKPDPVVKVDSVWVVVVEDATVARAVETAKALNDPFWLTLKPRHDWRHYLSDAKPAIDNGYVEEAKRVGYPAVLVLNAKDGDVLKAFKFKSIAEIDATVKGVAK